MPPHMPAATSTAAVASMIPPDTLTRTSRGVALRSTAGSVELSGGLLLCTGGLLMRRVRSGQPSGVLQRAAEQILDLSVDAPELAGRPSLQGVVDLRVEPKRKSLFVGHFLVCRGAPPPRPVPCSLRLLGNGCDIFLLQCVHWYNVPAFTTGSTPFSLHSTTRRLLTIAALRSSSSDTTFLRLSSFRAISTMPTAPSTIS